MVVGRAKKVRGSKKQKTEAKIKLFSHEERRWLIQFLEHMIEGFTNDWSTSSGVAIERFGDAMDRALVTDDISKELDTSNAEEKKEHAITELASYFMALVRVHSRKAVSEKLTEKFQQLFDLEVRE